MKTCLLALLVLSYSMTCFARTPKIKNGATVYIEPMGGYETYLATAFSKKHVPLIVVADREKAVYVITSTVPQDDVSSGQPGVMANGGEAAIDSSANSTGTQSFALNAGASIAMIDAYQIVFAYSAANAGSNQLQKTAEDCAKHLKVLIEKKK